MMRASKAHKFRSNKSMASDQIAIATNQALGSIAKQIEQLQTTLKMTQNHLGRMTELQQQTIEALHQQTRLLEDIRLHQK